ncbi:MAG: stalk domain-containing protein, partial [Eubacteriales bacterium]
MKTALKALLAVTICVTCSVVVLAADSVSVFVNDRPISAEAFIQDDSTYVPLRAVSEALGAKVEWDGNTRSVYIETSEETVVPNIIEQVSSSVVAVVGNYVGAGAASYSEYYSFGTGVIIKSGGVILTNAHVVRDMENL